MNSFLLSNKNLLTYSLIFLMVSTLFGFKFLISFLGNILLLVFLIPILIILILFFGINSFKSKIKTCTKCGSISISADNTCINCGSEFESQKNNENNLINNPGESTIDVQAEEVN